MKATDLIYFIDCAKFGTTIAWCAEYSSAIDLCVTISEKTGSACTLFGRREGGRRNPIGKSFLIAGQACFVSEHIVNEF